MPDQTITKTIPEAKVAKALQGYLKIYPNSETKDDPDWVDPEDGSTAPQVPKYSNPAWVREKDMRIFRRDIRRGLQMIANEAAKVEDDDDIVQ